MKIKPIRNVEGRIPEDQLAKNEIGVYCTAYQFTEIFDVNEFDSHTHRFTFYDESYGQYTNEIIHPLWERNVVNTATNQGVKRVCGFFKGYVNVIDKGDLDNWKLEDTVLAK